MQFVNTIAEIVHSNVDRYSGSANKNIGDAFLLVWKFKEEDTESKRVRKKPLDQPPAFQNRAGTLEDEKEHNDSECRDGEGDGQEDSYSIIATEEAEEILDVKRSSKAVNNIAD